MAANVFNNVRLGDLLISLGFINDTQLNDALTFQKQNRGKRLGEILVEMGFISEEQMLQALAQRTELKLVHMSEVHVHMAAVTLIQRRIAEKYCLLPVKVVNNVLVLVVNDPLNFYGLEDVRQITGMSLELMLCSKAEIDNAIGYYYSEVQARQAAEEAGQDILTEISNIENVDENDDTPIINLLNSLVKHAYSKNASDIHIEPFESLTKIRMRIDGHIMEFTTIKKALNPPLIARIKILSDLDIAEKRVPQDGHFRLKLEEEVINIRVSVIPTVFGEKAVLRLLTANSKIDNLGTFGMNEHNYAMYKNMLDSPNGLVYLTGPTGSGKTTTLYMTLTSLSMQNVNISTIEDPVERNLDNINQMQVNNQAGLTFETGLRALLRQDPDIIMVGETRDGETADISVRAAITGHLVLSTLHTNDAASTVVRLMDMGVESFMIASSLIGAVAQRLVRKVCPDCAVDVETTPEQRMILGEDVRTIKKAVGCRNCNYTGYRGRTAVHEILTVDKAVRKMVADGASVDEIKEYAVKNLGMIPLNDSIAQLVRDGTISYDEFLKASFNF